MNENEEARKRGQIESKDDPEILRLAKLEAIKKAEQEQIEEENSEIQKLSQKLSSPKDEKKQPAAKP